MKTIKIIDLLNKIANGEEVPKKIRINVIDDRNTIDYNFFYDEDTQEYIDDELFQLGARLILDRALNEKVEIIEDTPKEETKTPEKLETNNFFTTELEDMFRNKINEIIDYLKIKEK